MPPCKEWTGATMGSGYGQLPRPRHGTRNVPRATWMEAHGPIPDGLVVRHKCDNPLCYELEHLELGTQGQNIQDSYDRGRREPHGPKVAGELHGRALLTWEQVRQIRAEPTTPRAELAARYGVSLTTIKKVRAGTTWKEGSCHTG